MSQVKHKCRKGGLRRNVVSSAVIFPQVAQVVSRGKCDQSAGITIPGSPSTRKRSVVRGGNPAGGIPSVAGGGRQNIASGGKAHSR